VNGIASQLALVGVLILLNAAFAGSEMALITLNESRLRRLDEGGGAGALLARLARDPNRFLATIQIGITLSGFLASATAAVTLAEPLVEPLGMLGRWAEPAAIVSVTALLTFVTLVLGELVPKRVALQRAEAWGRMAARPLSLLAFVLRPVVWLLGESTDVVVRLLGGDPAVAREEVTDAELRDLVVARPGFTRQQREIVEGAFEIAERVVRDITVNRTQVFAVAEDTPVEEVVRGLIDEGHSRAVVHRGDLDEVVGTVHLRDLVHARGTVGQYARDALLMPETLGVLEALRRLRQHHQHLAVVIDEYGGTTGIVTLEDILEELVGEIYDEFDRDVSGVRRRPDGVLIVDGTFPVHDLPDLGVSLPAGPYTTVAGLVLHELGRLPQQQESADVGSWRLTALEVDDRAITRVQLTPLREGAVTSDPS
jgi:putative hemolysin